MPCSSSSRAIAVPARPAPKMTTSLTFPEPGRDQLAPLLRRLRASRSRRCGRRRGSSRRRAGRIISSPRMMLATFESGGSGASRSGTPRTVGLERLLDVELDELHLAVREDVRLPRGRHADRPRDRVRRLELGGDDEVDVELALAPDLEVLGVRRAHDGRRLRRDAPSRTSPRRGSPRRARCRRSAGRRPRAPASASTRRLAPLPSTVETS